MLVLFIHEELMSSNSLNLGLGWIIKQAGSTQLRLIKPKSEPTGVSYTFL